MSYGVSFHDHQSSPTFPWPSVACTSICYVMRPYSYGKLSLRNTQLNPLVTSCNWNLSFWQQNKMCKMCVLKSWRWRQHVSAKRRYSRTRQHDVITPQSTLWSLTDWQASGIVRAQHEGVCGLADAARRWVLRHVESLQPGWRCLRIGCWGEYLGLRRTRWQGSGVTYIMRILMTAHQILFGWSNREGWDRRGI